MTSFLFRGLCIAVLMGMAGVSWPKTSSAAETKLTLVYPFPDFLVYTKNCKNLAKKINATGKGGVQIEV